MAGRCILAEVFRSLAFLVASSGCQVFFNVDVPVDPPRLPIDHVEIEVSKIVVSNSTARRPVVVDDLYSPTSIAVQLSNGEVPTLVEKGIGRYEFETPNLAYTVTIEDPIGRFTLDHHVAKVEIGLHQVGRVGEPIVEPLPVSISTDLQDGAPTPVSELVHSTGVWSTGVDTNKEVAPFTFSWGSPEHLLYGPQTLLDFNANDFMYWAGYSDVSNGTGTHRALTSFTEFGVDMTTGPVILTVFPSTSPLACIGLSAARKDEVGRISSIAPDMFIEPNADWLINAIPARELGTDGAMLLAQQGQAINFGKDNIQYSNPFPGALTTASMFASQVRPIFPDVAVPLRVEYATRVHVEPFVAEPICNGDSLNLSSGTIGLIHSIELEATLLATDDQAIELAGDVEVTWSTTDEPIDHFFVKLFELVLTDPQRPSLAVVAVRNTIDRRVTFSRDLFSTDKQYLIAVDGRLGFPNAATGDFLRVDFPNGTSTASSSLFTVTK
jgi:hypothetical protein